MRTFGLLLVAVEVVNVVANLVSAVPRTKEQPHSGRASTDGETSRLVDLFHQPWLLPTITFVVGVSSGPPLIGFIRDLVSGQPENSPLKLPDDCGSISEPMLLSSIPRSFLSETGRMGQISSDETKTMSARETAEMNGFEMGLLDGAYMENNLQRATAMKGFDEGYTKGRNSRGKVLTSPYQPDTWTRSRELNRKARRLPWMASQSYNRGYGYGLELGEKREDLRTETVRTGYSRGLCARSCILAYREQWLESGGHGIPTRQQNDDWMLECLLRQRHREIEDDEKLLAAMRRILGSRYRPASPPNADQSSAATKGDYPVKVHKGKVHQNTLVKNDDDDDKNNADIFLFQPPMKINEVKSAFPPLPNWSGVRRLGHDAEQQLQMTGDHLMDVIKHGNGRPVNGGADGGYPGPVKPFSAIINGGGAGLIAPGLAF